MICLLWSHNHKLLLLNYGTICRLPRFLRRLLVFSKRLLWAIQSKENHTTHCVLVNRAFGFHGYAWGLVPYATTVLHTTWLTVMPVQLVVARKLLPTIYFIVTPTPRHVQLSTTLWHNWVSIQTIKINFYKQFFMVQLTTIKTS